MERRKNNQQQHHQQKGDSSDKNSNNSLVPVRLADIVIGTDITRGRGRPRKYPKNYQQQNSHTHNSEGTDNKNTNDNNKRGRGRPPKQDQQHFQLRPHNDNDYKETNKGSHSLTDKLPNKQGNISNQQNKSSMNMNIPGSNIAQRGPRPKQKIPPQHHHPQQQHRQHQVRTSGSPRPSSQQQQPARPALGGIGVQQQQLQQQSAPFPNCATDVLAQVGMLVKESAQNPRWNRVKVKDLQNLIDQDLLCLTPDRRSTRLNPLQYLRLLGIVCTYFNREVSNSDPQLRYMHFDIIFCGREGEVLLHDARIQFLVKICSLATQFPVYGLFEHVANWLSKVASDELKRSYAEKIVNELVEGFVLAPTEHKLHEYLLPLINHSFEFCANFIVFSICKETLGSVLALLIGDWLATRVDNFFHALNQNTHLSQPFCAQKFDLLLRYDCSKEAADKNADDEIHHRLHYVLVEITNMWRKRFEPQQQKRQAAVQQQSQNQLFMQPVVPNLEVAFQNIDALPALAQSRLLENLVCCIRVGFFPFHLLAPHRNRLSNLSAQQLAGPNGHLWQSLALFARAAQNE